MVVDVDTINLNVEIRAEEHLTYGGHFIQIDEGDVLRVWCPSCDRDYSFDECPEGLYKWEAICYLLGHYPEDCDGDAEDVKDRIHNILNQYVGKPATDPRLTALEHDIRNVVGDDVPVNIRTP